MLREPKTETIGFRCTADFKKKMIEIAYSKKMEPSEYMHEVIEKDIRRKLSEPSDTEKTFLELTFDRYTDKILSFISTNIDKRLARIEAKVLTEKEREAARILDELIDSARQGKLTIKDETKQAWFKKLIESPDMQKDIEEMRKIVADKVQNIKEKDTRKNAE
ncbi:MAG: hypothetical protein PHC61_05760 [Chitinivibrionales bacterium]|nr:hypothetical protein [Chitinivibrionales bacterium]